MHSYTVTHRFLPQQVNPLECALTKNASANLLECALAKSLDLKAPEMNTYKKGRGIPPPSTSPLAAIEKGARMSPAPRGQRKPASSASKNAWSSVGCVKMWVAMRM